MVVAEPRNLSLVLPLQSGKFQNAANTTSPLDNVAAGFFFAISLVVALFGFTGISEAGADIARVLFYIVIVLILLILRLTIFRNVSGWLRQ